MNNESTLPNMDDVKKFVSQIEAEMRTKSAPTAPDQQLPIQQQIIQQAQQPTTNVIGVEDILLNTGALASGKIREDINQLQTPAIKQAAMVELAFTTQQLLLETGQLTQGTHFATGITADDYATALSSAGLTKDFPRAQTEAKRIAHAIKAMVQPCVVQSR